MNAISKIKERFKTSSKNSGYETLELNQIKKGTPFVDLFPINPETLKSITEDMKVNGFDISQPVIIWKETNVLIDGHTRCEAAKRAGLKEVVVIYESFSDTDHALKYAYGLQFKRRNLTDADKFHFSETYMNNVGQGTKKSGWKKKELSEILSVSLGTAQKYISVITRGSDKLKESVSSGMLTINAAYKSLLDKEKQVSSSKNKKGEKVKKEKASKPSQNNKESSPKQVNINNLIQLDPVHIKTKLDLWGADIDVELSNFYPFKERLLAVYEILPEGSYLWEYTKQLMDRGGKDECL